jgi:hypothetical protein
MHVPIDIGKLTFGDGTSCYSFNSMHWGMASKVAVTAEKLRYGTTPSPPPKIAPISPRASFLCFSKLLLFEKNIRRARGTRVFQRTSDNNCSFLFLFQI